MSEQSLGDEIAALFVRKNSVYRLLGVDCFDLARDARSYSGNGRVICHPPCRSWGRYAHRSKGSSEEKELALWAADLVRSVGGVLEHPRSSQLWKRIGERPGDHFVDLPQRWFGHRAEKATRLLFSGTFVLRPLPPVVLAASVPVEHMCRAERERTPFVFAQWLINCLDCSY